MDDSINDPAVKAFDEFLRYFETIEEYRDFVRHMKMLEDDNLHKYVDPDSDDDDYDID